MAAVDWFATDVAAPPVRRPRARPQSVARARRRAPGLRLSGGIFWISAFAILLAGVVAVNVAVLRVNMSVNDLNKQQLDLQAQNARFPFGKKQFEAFMARLGCTMMVRGHEKVDAGFKTMYGEVASLLSLFSAGGSVSALA